MIWTSEIKNKFSIYILCSEVDRGISAKTALAQEGFDAYLFPDGESLYGRLETAPPHLIVLMHGSLEVPLEEFVQHVVSKNSEIRFLPVCPIQEIGTMIGYRPFNFSGIVIEGEGWLQRLAWDADEICKAIYLGYQNEQVYSLMEKANQESELLRKEATLIERRAESSTGISIQAETSKYQGAQTKDDVLMVFLKEIHHKMLSKNKKISSIYFRFMPTVHSFVAMQALGVDIESIQGVGGRLTTEELENLKSGIPSDLKKLMREGFQVTHCVYKTIYVNNELDGFFVAWSAQSELYPEEIENEFALFVLMYERCHFIRKLASLDLADFVTELHGPQYYLKHLAEELIRARRLQKPVRSEEHTSELQSQR